ncbi:MAG: tetratricopeptide repeat protein, partial [Dehalococcoidia bacterium]
GVLDIYEAQGDVYNIAHVSDQLGVCLGALGRLAEATVYFERARLRWEKLDHKTFLLQTLNNLGKLYYEQGNHQQAEEVLGQALAPHLGSDLDQAYLLASLADVQRDRGDFQKALEIYEQSLELSRKPDDAYLVIYNLDAMANTHRLMGDLNAAERLAAQAAAEAQERGGVYELGLCQITRGLILRDRGQLGEAATALEKAVELLKKGDAKRELARAYFHLAEAYYSQRRRRAALECLEIIAKLVEQLGYHHFLVVEAQRAPLLVQYGAANKVADGFYTRLLKQTKVTQASGEAEPAAEGEAGRLPKIEAFCFGHLRVCLDGREVSDLEWRSEKSKEMFFFFIANPRPLRREEIVAAIWPDLPEDKTSSAFHSNLYRLRKALHPECIVKDGGRYLLNPQGSFWYDVNEFHQALQEAEAAPEDSQERVSLLERAAALYKGAFAQDFYAEWVDPLRWQLEEQHLRLLASLAGAYFDRGDHNRSSGLCQQILALDEFNEAAWYRLLQSYLASGEVEAAKFAYRRYADLLRDNLQGEPSQQFRQLMRELAATKGPATSK